MTTPSQNETKSRQNMLGRLGIAVTCGIVPIWLLVGTYFKLADLSPANLPVVLVKGLGAVGLDLNFVLRFAISIELVVVGIIWILPPLARLVSGVLLASFLPIVVGDMMLGAASCGCFGPVQMPPIVTLIVDGVLLAGVIWLGTYAPSLHLKPELKLGRTLAAGVWVLMSFAIGFGIDAFGTRPGEEIIGDGVIAVESAALPAEGYYLPDYSSWEGRKWSELELDSWVIGSPEDLESGRQYVLLYRVDCEHCHELMEIYFVGPLDHPVTAIAVPERAGFPSEGVLPMACEECRQAELPAGVDWFFNTPVLVLLEDGVVQCAAEESVENPTCFSW
ncbi:MAG: hypothetical protein GY906_16695 [bacterium]|nr:hypothetical protein [bacterium]